VGLERTPSLELQEISHGLLKTNGLLAQEKKMAIRKSAAESARGDEMKVGEDRQIDLMSLLVGGNILGEIQ
jgi:hypothetical protein